MKRKENDKIYFNLKQVNKIKKNANTFKKRT